MDFWFNKLQNNLPQKKTKIKFVNNLKPYFQIQRKFKQIHKNIKKPQINRIKKIIKELKKKVKIWSTIKVKIQKSKNNLVSKRKYKILIKRKPKYFFIKEPKISYKFKDIKPKKVEDYVDWVDVHREQLKIKIKKHFRKLNEINERKNKKDYAYLDRHLKRFEGKEKKVFPVDLNISFLVMQEYKKKAKDKRKRKKRKLRGILKTKGYVKILNFRKIKKIKYKILFKKHFIKLKKTKNKKIKY